MTETAKSANNALASLGELRPVIKVIGVGGAGGNAINNMIASGLAGVDYVVANTDAQALQLSAAQRRIQLGRTLTEGLGAGSRPDIGFKAAEEAAEEIRAELTGAHMVFIAAGMGGGTGTGAASVIARIAREMQILTVAIVTKPFLFEGSRRARVAEAGIAELRPMVDTLIVIPNQNLFLIANERTTFAEAFQLADRVLHAGVACIVDLIMKDGLINLDFADVRVVMSGMGSAVMGTGEAAGPERARKAAEQALANPLIDNLSLAGARGLLVSIIGGKDMTLFEVDEAASRVRKEVDSDANIIVGASFDDALGDRIRVAIVAAGMGNTVKTDDARAGGPIAQPAGPQHPASAAPGPAPSANAAASTASPSPVASPPLPAIAAFDAAALDPARQAHPAPPPVPPRNAAPAGAQPRAAVGQAWQAPHGVIIEPSPPLRHDRVPPPAPAAAGNHPRLPTIEEFPPIAQREHAAKSSPNPQASGHRPPPLPPAAPSSASPSLLHRIVGSALGRSGSSANHESDTLKPRSAAPDGRPAHEVWSGARKVGNT